MSSESNLWNWLKCANLVLREDLHMCRVENSAISGMPDVEGCFRGNQFWIELKCIDRPMKESTSLRPKFRPTQIPWMKRRLGAHGKVFVLLQVGLGRRLSRYLIPSYKVALLVTGHREVVIKALSLSPSSATASEIIMIAATN